jgi:hypothetical protein
MHNTRITHWKDFPWQYVKRQKINGKVVEAREKWMAFTPRYLSLYSEWDPGMTIQAHGHNSDHMVFVLEGDMTCGDVHCPAGTHLELQHGDTFGPFIAGPNGTKLYMIMMGDPRSFPVSPEAYKKFLAERGIEPLPNPPIEMPLWLTDQRR